MNEIQNLLSNISLISKKYEDIARITGENFNVFRILNLESNEVRLHSAFLCELLNPNGSHGLKEIFLDLFLKQIKEKFKEQRDFIARFEKFDSKNCIASTEIHIGFKNADETEGGRIDILIKDKTNNHIIIENKIYALDQDKQLVRYNNFKKEAPIFYLTLELDENKPSKESIGDLIKGDDFVCISYKEDILEWLEECRKEATIHSILRETLTQYINLIKNLTKQTMNEEKKNDIVEQICASSDNIKAAEEICKNLETAKQVLFFKCFSGIEEYLKKIGFSTNLDANFGQVYSRFCFSKEEWEYGIAFLFWKEGNYLMGIYRKDKNHSEENLKEKIESSLLGIQIAKNGSVLGWHTSLSQTYIWLRQCNAYYGLSWNDLINGERKGVLMLIKEIISALDNANIINNVPDIQP